MFERLKRWRFGKRRKIREMPEEVRNEILKNLFSSPPTFFGIDPAVGPDFTCFGYSPHWTPEQLKALTVISPRGGGKATLMKTLEERNKPCPNSRP